MSISERGAMISFRAWPQGSGYTLQVRARSSLWAFYCYPSRVTLAFLSRLMLNTSGNFVSIREIGVIISLGRDHKGRAMHLQVRARSSLWAFHCYPSRSIFYFLGLGLNTSGNILSVSEIGVMISFRFWPQGSGYTLQVRARSSLWAFHCYPSRGILAFFFGLILNVSRNFLEH